MATLGSKIRAYFHSALVTATGLPDSKVLKSPRFHVEAVDLPIVSVYTHSDKPVDADAVSDRPHDRIYTVAVEINVAAREEEDATDALSIAVRSAILTDGTLGGLCSYTTWASQEWGSKENELAESATLLLFSCHYLWRPGA